MSKGVRTNKSEEVKLCVPILRKRRDQLNDLAFLNHTTLYKLVNDILARELSVNNTKLLAMTKIRQLTNDITVKGEER